MSTPETPGQAAIAAAAPAPPPFSRDQLETALAGAIQEIIDEEEAAAAPAPAGEGGLTWEAWYLADGNSRTLAQDFNESKRDAMRRAFHAGKAAAQPQAAPGREREALEDIARAIQGATDTGLPLDRDWLVNRAVYGLGQLPADAPAVLSPHYHTNEIQCRDCQLETAMAENADLAGEIERLRGQAAPELAIRLLREELDLARAETAEPEES